jgi:hypothetical protein
MKIVGVVALIGLAAAATMATAQVNSGNAELNNAIEMVRSMSRLERKAVITEQLAMTNDESVRFWPVYDAYTGEIKGVDDRLVQLILDYAARYDNLSDQMALDMVDKYFEIEMDRLKVRTKYVRKFDDVLAPKKLARFIQVENKLNVVSQLYLADEIPLVQ